MDFKTVDEQRTDDRAAVDVLEQDICDQSPFLLDLLLQDKTTGKNILWACGDYEKLGSAYAAEKEILPALITGKNTTVIQPRVAKAKAEQRERTRKSAEVFTPSWICCLMNNFCDAEWFGRENVFNTLNGHDWTPTAEPVAFDPDGRKTTSWPRYVDSRRLEITCGEAPYLASRYDATTGEPLPVERRIGVLDRKLRVVSENTANETDWFFWARRAYESTYGYEYQGDNLLLARENMLCAFSDYHFAKFGKSAPLTQLKQIANIIAWNVWQMDGLKDCVPFRAEQCPQLDLFADIPSFAEQTDCIIKDWRSKKILKFKELKGINTMKFDFVIGNPPYQRESVGANANDTPVYHLFYDAALSIGNKVELITPARFLFNAGGTPQDWNERMLNDIHLKIHRFEQDGTKFFPYADITGGIVITYHDNQKEFEKIEVFTPFPELNSIREKTASLSKRSLCEIITNRGIYRYSDKAYSNEPDEMKKTADRRIAPSCFERMPNLFRKEIPDDGHEYIKIYGNINKERVYRYFRKDYVSSINNLHKYKVIVPKANGCGAIGEDGPTPVIGIPLILPPLIGFTETYISIGETDSVIEAEAILKYVKSKFARALLGILKVTQNNAKPTWLHVPLQDFTEKSDIDWSKSVREIDQQLYAKYGLSDDEIAFIEKNVKEMA